MSHDERMAAVGADEGRALSALASGDRDRAESWSALASAGVRLALAGGLASPEREALELVGRRLEAALAGGPAPAPDWADVFFLPYAVRANEARLGRRELADERGRLAAALRDAHPTMFGNGEAATLDEALALFDHLAQRLLECGVRAPAPAGGWPGGDRPETRPVGRDHTTLLGRLADAVHLEGHARDGTACEGAPGTDDHERAGSLVAGDLAEGGDPADLLARVVAQLEGGLPRRRRPDFRRLLAAHGLDREERGS
ncbi:MAG: hypothetical protein U0838_00680 [Chloroflexota bacterium]